MTPSSRIWRYPGVQFTGAVAGLIAALLTFDPMILNPRSVDWLVRDDLTQQYLGWIAFRSTPWQIPLGTIHGYADPPGTTLGFVDAFPWFSVLMRALLESVPSLEKWFGSTGQITSLWLVFSLMLQGFFAASIFSRLTPRNLPLIASGTISLIFAPVWWHRMNHGHPSLCGQWLILAALTLSLSSGEPDGPSRLRFRKIFFRLAKWCALQFVAAGIHPYLAAMTCAIGIAAVLERKMWLRSVVGAVAQVLTVFFVFWLFGYFSLNPTGANEGGGGFHYFGADLLSLINPMKMGGLLPSFFQGWTKAGQYEGYGWIGLGTIFLALFWFSGRHNRRNRRMEWVWSNQIRIVVLLLALFSLGSNIRIGGFWLIDLETPYQLIKPVVTSFRAAGRFIWPLYYLLAVQLFVHAGRVMQKRRIGVVPRIFFFSAVAAFNILDNPFLKFQSDLDGTDRHQIQVQTQNQMDRLSALTAMPASVVNLSGISRMNLVPPYLASFSCGNLPAGNFDGKAFEEWRITGMWAAKNGLTANSGAFARYDTAVLNRTCEVQRNAVLAGNLDPQAVYVLSNATPDPVAFAAIESRATCAAGPGGIKFCRVDAD